MALARKTVGIIGTGITGPVLALHLLTHPTLRARYHPVLFDRAADSHTLSPTERLHSAGAAIGLFPNGLFPLYELGLRNVIEARSCPIESLSIWRAWPGEEGKVGKAKVLGRSRNESWAADLDTAGMAIERRDLVQILLDAVGSRGGKVQWSRKLVNLATVEDGKVRVEFEDGRGEVLDLLVGADGAFSAVRRAIMMDKYGKGEGLDRQWLPEFVGAAGIYGIASLGGLQDDGNPDYKDDTLGIWLDGGNLSSSPLPGNKIRWDLQVVDKEEPAFPPRQSHDFDSSSSKVKRWVDKLAPGSYDPQKTLAVLRDHASYYHPATDSFERLVDASDRIIHSPLRQAIWEQNDIQNGRNMLCIGDAGRVLLPSAGQGTNMGIEDATMLAKALLDQAQDTDQPIATAIRMYVGERVPRNKKYFAMAQWARKLAMGETWFWRLIRDWLPMFMSSTDGKITQKGNGVYPFDFRARLDVADA